MFSCPHCEKPGISLLRKAVLSPGLLATCNSCGGPSSTRYPSWLAAMLPGSILMIAAMFVDTDSVEWSLNIIGLFLMIIIPLMFAPLHKED
jgi:prepilin signal peptidase PulO-like enzyme (type II secretory pathway)